MVSPKVSHRRLFALPRLPGSLSSIDDGAVAEEDSVEFRENLNKLSGECGEKLDSMGDLYGLTQELAEATLALAAVEARTGSTNSVFAALTFCPTSPSGKSCVGL